MTNRSINKFSNIQTPQESKQNNQMKFFTPINKGNSEKNGSFVISANQLNLSQTSLKLNQSSTDQNKPIIVRIKRKQQLQHSSTNEKLNNSNSLINNSINLRKISSRIHQKNDFIEDCPNQEIDIFDNSQTRQHKQIKNKKRDYIHQKILKFDKKGQEKIEQQKDNVDLFQKENQFLQQQIQSLEQQIDQEKNELADLAIILDLYQYSDFKPKLQDYFQEENVYVIDLNEIEINMDKPLGKGGFGVVYQCKYQGKNYAVKISEISSDQLQMMLTESIAQIYCQHKNLVKIQGISFEQIENNVKVYFVMELMVTDLRKMLFQEKVII